MTKMANLAAIILILVGVISAVYTTVGAAASRPVDTAPGSSQAAEGEPEASVTCRPLGLYGDITADVLVGSLSDGSENLTFVATSNGLYVLGLDGKLRHFLYCPFRIQQVALIEDTTDDGIREVVVALADMEVPALRCYNGATWDKLWQFAPMTRIWARLWAERQLPISGLEVVDADGSQRVVISSGRQLLSVDARCGTVDWRFGAASVVAQMAAVSDINSDGADDVFAGTADGHLFLLSGKTGDLRWRTKLPEIKDSTASESQSKVSSIAAVSAEKGKVVVTSIDGRVLLFDLAKRSKDWDVSITESGPQSQNFPVTAVPDTTGDGLPEILVIKGAYGSYGSIDFRPVVMLGSEGGEVVWEKEMHVWEYQGVLIGSFGGQPVILEPGQQQIGLMDLKDGATVLKTIPVSTLDRQEFTVRQIGEDRYLLFNTSYSDVSIVSASGETLCGYLRIANVKALAGDFVGDATEDTLFSAEWKSNYRDGYAHKKDGASIGTTEAASASQAEESEARILQVMDGSTGKIAWSYEVPVSDLKNNGGLKGIEVVADLVGSDNIQDIIGYCEGAVYVFSGRDGTLSPGSPFRLGQPVLSLHVVRNGASGNAIAVGIQGSLLILDGSGNPLRTVAGREWVEDPTVEIMVLDDLNSDNLSDLAIVTPTKIVLLGSTDNAAGFQRHLSFTAETACAIGYAEAVPDSNGDGVRELAYIQQDTNKQFLLVERSPVGGEELLRATLLGPNPAIDLACGDFNGDGYADSLQYRLAYVAYDASGTQAGGEFKAISGRDGATLWMYSRLTSSYYVDRTAWNASPPAKVIGDVNGDGKDDLAWTVDRTSEEYSGYRSQQQQIEIYDVAQNKSLARVPVGPLLSTESLKFRPYDEELTLKIYVGTDGHRLAVVASAEPWLPNYDPDATDHIFANYLAVLDLENGQRLASLARVSAMNASLFETHREGVLGIGGAGGVYYLRLNSELRTTSPASRARTSASVGITWEGASAGNFVQVFVDGVRYEITISSGADLYLSRGSHDVVLRSIDEYGRILYAPSDVSAPLSIRVAPSPWKPVLLLLTLVVLLTITALLFYARLHRMQRARQRKARS